MRYLDSWSRRIMLAGGGVVLALTVVGCGDDLSPMAASRGADHELADASGGKPATSALATDAPKAQLPPATGQSQPGGTGGTAGSPAGLATSLDRKIIFNAKLDLEAVDVRASFSDVSRLARGAGGFIERSSLDERPGRDDAKALYATLSLRVPSTKYGDVVADLRALQGVKITKEQASSAEVTEQYTDLTSRQRNLERSEGQYLKLLEQTKTIQEILIVQERLDGVRLQIEQIQGKLKVLDNLTELATLDVTISPPPIPAKTVDSGPKTITEAFADAWSGSLQVARYLAAAGAVLTVAAVWLTIPVLLAISGLGFFRRRQRQSAPANS